MNLAPAFCIDSSATRFNPHGNVSRYGGIIYNRRKPRITYEKLRNSDNRRNTRRNGDDRRFKTLQRRTFIAALRLSLSVPPQRKAKEKTLLL